MVNLTLDHGLYLCTVSRHRKGGRWLENLCLIGILFALLRFANNQALLFTGYLAASRCSVILNVSIAMYFIAIHPVYLFLWVRQVRSGSKKLRKTFRDIKRQQNLLVEVLLMPSL